MAEEEDPWGFDDSGDTKAEDTSAPAAAPAGGEQTAPAAEAGGEQAAPAEGAGETAPPPPPPEDDGYRKPIQLYRHWVRPQYLQYKYIYNYRTNYYDDVIDYLDKKQRGVCREIPRPQTWAERVLRTNVGTRSRDSYRSRHSDDHHLIQVLAASIKPHNYHTKSYINRKYASVL